MGFATLLSIVGAAGSLAALIASAGFLIRKSQAERHLVARLKEDTDRLQREYRTIVDQYASFRSAGRREAPQLAKVAEIERELIMEALAKLDLSDRRIVARPLDQPSAVGRLLYGKKLLEEALGIRAAREVPEA